MAHPMSNSRGGYHIHAYHIITDKTKKTFKGNTSNQSLDLKKYKSMLMVKTEEGICDSLINVSVKESLNPESKKNQLKH